MSKNNPTNYEDLSKKFEKQIKNRVFRAFFSSTFKDMKDERDYLDQTTFRNFKHTCYNRDVEFIPIEMLWGITSEEWKENKTVKRCLEAIETCPFFIGMLGYRYGTVFTEGNIDPATLYEFPFLKDVVKNGSSMTEIEFRYAFLGKETVLEKTVTWETKVFIRSNKFNSSTEVKALPDYREDESGKLKTLKSELQSKNYCDKDYDSCEELGTQVEDYLNQLLDQYFPEEQKLSIFEFKRELLKNFLKKLAFCRLFCTLPTYI